MSKEEVEKYIKENVGIGTVILLKNYLEFGIISRRFMLKDHHDMLQLALDHQGRFSNCTDKDIQLMQCCFYMETLERVCLVIEDFCAICRGLWGDLRQFPQSLQEDYKLESVLKEFDEAKWHVLLRYARLDELPIDKGERDFLQDIRTRNINALSEFVELLKEFLGYYWRAYIKYKHANTLLYGFGNKDLDGYPAMLIPVVDRRSEFKDIKGIIVTLSMYQKWHILLNTLVQLTTDVVSNTVLFIESGGKPFALRIRFCPLAGEEQGRMDEIEKKYEKDRVVHPVEVKVVIDVRGPGLDRFRKLLTRLEAQMKPDVVTKK